MKKVELLAPAGNFNALMGAIHAGANAVYLAGKKFGARAFAENFDLIQIKEAIDFAHLRGVFVYVTVNTLIFNEQIDDFILYTDALVQMGVDALILQDFGMIALLRHRYPTLDLHVSTQANTHHISQVKLLKDLGVNRIVLARETSIDLIKEIKREVDIEIEVFIHGALCTSYSGQCLMSAMAGGRSANLGSCAQPCRLPYEILEDGQTIDSKAYHLSSKDLMTIEYIEDLIALGVDSLKIEGRMRREAYVIQTVLSYRTVISKFDAHQVVDINQEITQLKKVFNRSYTKGHLFFEKPQDITHTVRPNHQGIFLGTVIKSMRNQVVIRLETSLSVRDGIRFLVGLDQDIGDEVSKIMVNQQILKTAQANQEVIIDVKHPIKVGTKVLKTKDYDLENDLNQYLDPLFKCIPVKAHLLVKVNHFMMLEVTVAQQTFNFVSDFMVEKSLNQHVSKAVFINQFSKLGHTPFYYDVFEVTCDNEVYVPLKKINDLRKEMIESIIRFRTLRLEKAIDKSPLILSNNNHAIHAGLTAKVETIEQFHAVVTSGIKTIYIPKTIHIDQLKYPDINIILMSPRIRTPYDQITEENLTHILYKSDNLSFYGDVFLNVTNVYTAYLLKHFNANRMVLSLELSRTQVQSFYDLYQKTFNEDIALEVVIYGRSELMVMNHCMISKSYPKQTSCNLCMKHKYALRNQANQIFPLLTDQACRLRLINHEPLCLFSKCDALKQWGIKTFRLDFTVESKDEVQHIITQIMKHPNDRLSFKYTEGRF